MSQSHLFLHLTTRFETEGLQTSQQCESTLNLRIIDGPVGVKRPTRFERKLGLEDAPLHTAHAPTQVSVAEVGQSTRGESSHRSLRFADDDGGLLVGKHLVTSPVKKGLKLCTDVPVSR